MGAACIFGCAGPTLSLEERRFFGDVSPWGFILFARNIETPDQVRRLTGALRETVGWDAPVLIDQEGGRVRRLRPPLWPSYPAAAAYGGLGDTPEEALAYAGLGGRLIAHDLAALGIDVDCAPVADLPTLEADPIIGDRAFHRDGEEAARLARAFAEGLLAGGVLPVVKHAPGHGRACVDSHLELPVVEAASAELERDFLPFRRLNDLPMAMTAHVIFTALDPVRPVTTSSRGIEAIRQTIGFAGLLMSDDLSMKALSGPMSGRTRDALSAGCDVALHCNGDFAEMVEVAAGASALTETAVARAASALARRSRPQAFDLEAGRRRLEQALIRAAAA